MSITSWHKLMSASNLEDVLEVTLRIPMYNKYALEKGMDRDQYHELIVNEVIEIAPHIEGIDTIKNILG